MNKNGYKKTIFEKLGIDTKSFYMYSDIFKIYADSIKEYYKDLYTEDKFYNSDTKTLYIQQRFSSQEEPFLLEFNVNVQIAKEIIEKNNFESIVIFKTDFKNIDFFESVLLVNYQLIKGTLRKERVDKPILQKINFNLEELKNKETIEIRKIEPIQFKELEQITQQKNLELKLVDLSNKIKEKDIQLLKHTKHNNSIIEETLTNKFTELINSSIEKVTKTIENQEKQINSIKDTNNDIVKLEKNLTEKLTKLVNDSLDGVNKTFEEQEQKINSIKNNSSDQEIENLLKQIEVNMSFKSKKIEQLQEKLIKKEEATKKIIEQFTSKFEKLEKKLSEKKKTTPKALNRDMIMENKSINKNSGVIVKRESFDDF